jgi:hypothetical protein
MAIRLEANVGKYTAGSVRTEGHVEEANPQIPFSWPYHTHKQAMPHIQIFSAFMPQKPGFSAKVFNIGFVLQKVSKVFSKQFSFPPSAVTPLTLLLLRYQISQHVLTSSVSLHTTLCMATKTVKILCHQMGTTVCFPRSTVVGLDADYIFPSSTAEV